MTNDDMVMMMIQIQSTAHQGELTLRKTLVSRPRSQRPRGKDAQRPCPQRINADKGHRSVRTTFSYARTIVSTPGTVQVFLSTGA